MVRRFSRDPHLIVRLRNLGVKREIARSLVERVAVASHAPPPEVTFHGGRGSHTGYCRQPRQRAVELTSEQSVQAWEATHGPWPDHGMIRLGDPTSLGTIAHELGHHLVNFFEPLHTAAHGKAWVAWFDLAASLIDSMLEDA